MFYLKAAADGKRAGGKGGKSGKGGKGSGGSDADSGEEETEARVLLIVDVVAGLASTAVLVNMIQDLLAAGLAEEGKKGSSKNSKSSTCLAMVNCLVEYLMKVRYGVVCGGRVGMAYDCDSGTLCEGVGRELVVVVGAVAMAVVL